MRHQLSRSFNAVPLPKSKHRGPGRKSLKTKGILLKWCNDHPSSILCLPRLQYSLAGVSAGIIQPMLPPSRPIHSLRFFALFLLPHQST